MKRQTLQKTIILEALHRLCNHPTPAMVYEEVHKSYPSISQATVFRVLAGECDAGNAQRVYAPGCPARYEFGTRKHWHISCRVCGRVADIEMADPDADLRTGITDSNGFTVERFYVEFSGL
ncbi:MAG: hypothetical protein BHW37_01390, partial [Firmicutes bacterium CAG:272_52_7]